MQDVKVDLQEIRRVPQRFPVSGYGLMARTCKHSNKSSLNQPN